MIKRFKTPLYGVKFQVIIYEEDSELQKYCPEAEFDPGLETFDGGVFTYKDELYLVLRKFMEKNIQYPTPGIIAHEAKHLVNRIFTYIGYELDQENDEPECYLLSWVVNRIYETIK